MKCPYCGHEDSRVTDSRTVDNGIRRRRECIGCGARFTTYERVQMAELFVVKRDGRREPFSRDKLLAGIRKACEKRPLEAGAVEQLADQVEAVVHVPGKAEVPSSVIGDLVMEGLRELDHIAYIRFASVYRAFADVEDLREELERLNRSRGGGQSPNQLPLLPEEEFAFPAGDRRVLPLRPRPRKSRPGPSSRNGTSDEHGGR
jgi:transcriptional repressor NrdR